MKRSYKLLDPKADIVFKKVFGQNAHILKSFLNGVLPLPEDALIESLEYLTPEQSPRIPVLKNSIADVRCVDSRGRQFIVEMQMEWTKYFLQRITFGASKAYVDQLYRGEGYDMLCPVYGLGILNANFDDDPTQWFHHYRTINVKNTNKVIEGIELILIELPKFTPQSWAEKKLGVLWLRFLKEIKDQSREVDEALFEVEEISEAIEIIQEAAFSREELMTYDQYWDAISIQKTFENVGYKKGVEEGYHEGVEKGIQEGHKEGLKEGIEKGKEELTQEMARKMNAEGFSLASIQSITGLSLAELQLLLK